jgi:hypothetical protein
MIPVHCCIRLTIILPILKYFKRINSSNTFYDIYYRKSSCSISDYFDINIYLGNMKLFILTFLLVHATDATVK